MLQHDWWSRGPYHYWWRDIASLIPPGSGLLVDVGCGDGRHRQMAAGKGYDWVGLDVERRAPEGVPVELIQDGRFPLADGVARCVLCCQVLEHVDDLDTFAHECNRILEPGGLIYGSHSWLEPDHDAASYSGLSHDGIRVYLGKHGLDLLRVEPGIHVGVLLLYKLFDARVASRFARAVAAIQAVSDRRRMKQQRPEDAGLSLLEVQRENALRLAGHLLWVAQKSDLSVRG